MAAQLRTKLAAAAVGLLLLLFLTVGVISALAFIVSGELTAQLIGWAVLALCGIGLWYLVVEVRFGFVMQAMARQLEREGGLPEDTLPKTASGRYEREAADAYFTQLAATADADNWRDLYRVALAYDAAGDRSRARRTMRRAAKLYRGERSLS